MDFSICSGYLTSLSRVKCVAVPIGHFSSGLLYQKHTGSIILRVQIYLEIPALSATRGICQLQGCGPKPSDILGVFIDFEKSGKIL